jgi:hypothetical protein
VEESLPLTIRGCGEEGLEEEEAGVVREGGGGKPGRGERKKEMLRSPFTVVESEKMVCR